MELSEKERLMLLERKDEILNITNEIIENVNSDEPDVMKLKKDINSVLSLTSTLLSYSSSKNYNVDAINKLAYLINIEIEKAKIIYEGIRNRWLLIKIALTQWCNMVNAIQFNFTKKGIKIKFPKIDINLFKQSLSGIKLGIENELKNYFETEN